MLGFFNDTDARVIDEVARITNLLSELKPGALEPKYPSHGGFRIPLIADSDKVFMEQVAQKFRDAGWIVELVEGYDIGGENMSFELNQQGSFP